MTKSAIIKLGTVSLGAKFVYRTIEILGSESKSHRKPPFEGEVLTVVGFKPRYVNNVVVRAPDGSESLLPVALVEKALSLKSLRIQVERPESDIL